MNNLVLRIFASVVMPAILFLNPAGAPTTVQPHQTISSNAGGLDSLLDPIFAHQMARLHIPGAVIAIVKDGKVLFTKGYGYADIEKKTPVVPEKTIFRIGSITKVFTATAVMQLADRGRVSLKDDVNKYLKGFQIPATYAQPITFANLLTHTSGLDEITPGRRTSDKSKVVALGEFLKTRMVRILPPGQIISYSASVKLVASDWIDYLHVAKFNGRWMIVNVLWELMPKTK
ncbi:MAG: serine hydrolase [Pyrinomonadaceae bacterium]